MRSKYLGRIYGREMQIRHRIVRAGFEKKKQSFT